jgi:hypothetical protein
LTALVVILVLLAIVVSVCFYAAGQHKNKKPGTGPAQNNGNPGFRIHSGQEPGFKIISMSGSPQPSPPLTGRPPRNLAPTMPGVAAQDFNLQEVSQNLTAICKLTGRRAGDCHCDRHKAKK